MRKNRDIPYANLKTLYRAIEGFKSNDDTTLVLMRKNESLE